MENVVSSKQKVIDYFTRKESRWGYSLLLKGVKHFGYYPEGREKISMTEAQQLMVDKLYEKLSLKAGSLLLDAGCGEGGVATYLASKYQFQVKGVDLLDFSIEKANIKRARLALENKVEFRVGDYEDLDLPDGMFDGVFAMETLVHATDYQKALWQFRRVLKPSGKLVLFEYSICPLENIPPGLRETVETVIQEGAMHSLPYFVHERFPEILEKAGFQNVTAENITPRIIPMLKRFHQIAFMPYWFVKLLRLQRKFVNMTAGAEGYKNIVKNDFGRYNIITAIKPA